MRLISRHSIKNEHTTYVALGCGGKKKPEVDSFTKNLFIDTRETTKDDGAVTGID
jgi:hypothetical protein